MRIYFLSPLILQKLIWIPTNVILHFFCSLKIVDNYNQKNIKGPLIFACNHASEFDPFFVPATLPFFSSMSPIFYVSREKSFYSELGFRRIFYGGLFFKAWGSYPVKVGLNDYASSLTEQIRIIRDGGSICIFPEGGTTKDGQFKKAKAGVSYLSQVTRTSIIPVYIGNTFRLSLVDIFLRRRSLIVIYGKEIDPPPVDSSIDDLKVHANSIMDVILELKNSI